MFIVLTEFTSDTDVIINMDNVRSITKNANNTSTINFTANDRMVAKQPLSMVIDTISRRQCNG